MNDLTKTGSIRVIDITHKPKRSQRDNIMRSMGNINDDSTTNSGDNASLNMRYITLERAIKFYEENSSDHNLGNLYSSTAKWLRNLLSSGNLKSSSGESNGVEVVNYEDSKKIQD